MSVLYWLRFASVDSTFCNPFPQSIDFELADLLPQIELLIRRLFDLLAQRLPRVTLSCLFVFADQIMHASFQFVVLFGEFLHARVTCLPRWLLLQKRVWHGPRLSYRLLLHGHDHGRLAGDLAIRRRGKKQQSEAQQNQQSDDA